MGKDETLVRKIKKDKCMHYAVKECYESLKYILELLIVRDLEKRYNFSFFSVILSFIWYANLLRHEFMVAL